MNESTTNSGELNLSEKQSGEVIIPSSGGTTPIEESAPIPTPESQIPPISSTPTDTPQSPQISDRTSALSNFPLKRILMALVIVFVLILLIGGGYVFYKSRSTSSSATEVIENITPTDTVSNTSPTEVPSLKTYTNQKFGLSFAYPNTWIGPEVYEYEDGVFIEIGTDTLYPYGTDRLSRAPSKANSYFVTIQYTKKPANQTNEDYLVNSPWLAQTMPVITLGDGESIFSARSQTTKIRNLEIVGFTGAEYIDTLSPEAQTEITYSRNVILMNDTYDTIRVMGSPAAVDVPQGSTWQDEYKKLEEQYLNDFRSILNSLKLIQPSAS